MFEKEPQGDEWELIETNEVLLDFEDLEEEHLSEAEWGKMVGLMDVEEPVLQLNGHLYKGERDVLRGTGVIFNVGLLNVVKSILIKKIK